jgi:hypothetical protein
VIRKRSGRVATIVSLAALASMLLGTGIASAANPTWDVGFTRLPDTVSAGNDAGWEVTVVNHGPSNINDLNITLTSEVAGQLPSYLEHPFRFSAPGTETCSTATGNMVCNVGTLGDDQTVTFIVAFHVADGTTGSYDLNVGLRAGTGDTGSDTGGPGGGGHSRGDEKLFTNSTGINSSANKDSGFVVGDGTFVTTGNLGRGNKQTTALETTDSLIPVTIEDGPLTTAPCTLVTECGRLVGEWSLLNVNGGNNSHPIKVTITIWGGAVPGGVGVEDIYLLHTYNDGTTHVVDAVCNATHSNTDCLESVTKVGNNFKIVAWFTNNGAGHGAF